MVSYSERYNLKPAVAWLRGHSSKTGVPKNDSELLEHIPGVDKAVAAAVKMAKKYAVVPEAKEAHWVQWQCV